jgi:hypothetical protein
MPGGSKPNLIILTGSFFRWGCTLSSPTPSSPPRGTSWISRTRCARCVRSMRPFYFPCIVRDESLVLKRRRLLLLYSETPLQNRRLLRPFTYLAWMVNLCPCDTPAQCYRVLLGGISHTRRGKPSGGSVGRSTETSATRSAPSRRRTLLLWVVAYGVGKKTRPSNIPTHHRSGGCSSPSLTGQWL